LNAGGLNQISSSSSSLATLSSLLVYLRTQSTRNYSSSSHNRLSLASRSLSTLSRLSASKLLATSTTSSLTTLNNLNSKCTSKSQVREMSSNAQGLESIKAGDVEEFNSHDGIMERATRDRHSADPTNRAFTYFVLGGGRFLYATTVRMLVIRSIAQLSASADVMALAKVEVDLTKVFPGTTLTVKWRGKPIFIRNRTPSDIAEATKDDKAELKDPAADAGRVKKPEWLVLIGVCTHLGCVPLSNSGNFGGWFCPCHGSHYDKSGRIRLGPAPLNLDIPPYEFIDDKHILLGN